MTFGYSWFVGLGEEEIIEAEDEIEFVNLLVVESFKNFKLIKKIRIL